LFGGGIVMEGLKKTLVSTLTSTLLTQAPKAEVWPHDLAAHPSIPAKKHQSNFIF